MEIPKNSKQQSGLTNSPIANDKEQPTHIAIAMQDGQSLVDYLQGCPYKEVAKFIQILATAKGVVLEDKK